MPQKINKENKPIYVINSLKEKEPFSANKVYNSAIRIGADKKLAEKITETIKSEAYPGIRTYKIFERIKEILFNQNPGLAIKFSLKEGMRRLGPTGFPFEKYIGEIFLREGYDVKLNQQISGKCLDYEVDFLASNSGEVLIGECKFRNKPEEGIVHSNDVLYHYAKFEDIINNSLFIKKNGKGKIIKTILVTNAKFSRAAIKFAECKSISLLGWRYPPAEGLEKIIDKKNLYPITSLPSLGSSLAQIFSKRKIMLVEDLLNLDAKKFSEEEKVDENFIIEAKKEAKNVIS